MEEELGRNGERKMDGDKEKMRKRYGKRKDICLSLDSTLNISSHNFLISFSFLSLLCTCFKDFLGQKM